MSALDITAPAFLRGGGELAGLIAAYPWERTALGPISGWPSHVRHTVALMLRSDVPMVALFGGTGVMIYNDAYSVFAGGRHPRLLGSPVREGWPEVAEFNDNVMREGLAGRTLTYKDQELTLLRRGTPEQVWMNLDYTPVLDDEGRPAAVLAIVVETTEKVKAQQRLSNERRRLHQMFEQAPGFIFTLAGPDHVFEFTNAAHRKLFGRMVVGKSIREAFPELAGQGYFEALDRVYRTGEPFRAEAAPAVLSTRVGGQPEQLYLSFVFQPLFSEAGRVTGIFCEGFDVSETVRAYAALQRTRDWLQEGLQAAQMVAFEWNFGSRTVRYSQNAQQVLGHLDGAEESSFGSVHPEDRAQLDRAVEEARSTLGQFQLVSRRIRPDNGETIWVDTRGRAYPDAQGKAAYMRGIVIDVTERIRSEQALRDASRRKDEFLAMLAHELRNPLAPIANASALLARSAGDPRAVRGAGEVIGRQVRHMSELLDDLLDVSRVTRGLIQLEQVPLDLREVVHSAVEQGRPLLDARGHELALALPERRVGIVGDRTRLVQVLVNLLTNAAKFTPPGGRVALSLQAGPGWARLSVEDNGSGIDAVLLPHVFELFTQGERTPDRTQGGLGIGLALVKAIVGGHGGEVQAESPGRGRGSRFTIALPLAIEAAASAPAEPERPAAVKPMRILVTDDNVDAAESLAMLLELDSHRVQVCFDGAQALRWAQREVPDVCILDVGLPDMTGLELSRRLRANPALRDTLFVALTGYGQPKDRAATSAAGFHHHLVKPVEPEALHRLLASHAAQVRREERPAAPPQREASSASAGSC